MPLLLLLLVLGSIWLEFIFTFPEEPAFIFIALLVVLCFLSGLIVFYFAAPLRGSLFWLPILLLLLLSSRLLVQLYYILLCVRGILDWPWS